MREINKVIVHCTATPENRVVTVEDVRQWHKARGWSDIGYHIMIYLDGTVHEGRPIERSGAHCKGQNKNSIGIAYVGGVDKDMNPKDTRTECQKEASRLHETRLGIQRMILGSRKNQTINENSRPV